MSFEELFPHRKLLQLEDSEFSCFICCRAQQFAVLGYVDVAKRVVSRLNSHKKFREQTIRPLWLLWASLGDWPVGEREKFRQKITKQREQASKHGDEDADEQDTAATITTKDEDDEIQSIEDVFARTWFYDAFKLVFIDQIERKEVENLESHEIAKGIRSLIGTIEELEPHFRDASTGAAAMYASARLVSILDLRLLLQGRGYEEDGLISVEEIMDRIGKRMETNQQIDYLSECRRAWEVLKGGALSKAIGVNDQKIREYARQLENTLDERIAHGKLPLDHLTMKQMLETLERNTLTNPESLEPFGDKPPSSLFHDPATQEEIVEAERRLEIELPADYKELLSISNGFEQSWGGILNDPPLHPVREIRWLDDDEDYFIDLDLDLVDAGYWCDIWPTVGKVIEIGTEEIDHIWLIPPPKTQECQNLVSDFLKSDDPDNDDLKKKLVTRIEEFAGSMEEFMNLKWCVVSWAAGGSATMKTYPSFTAYMRDRVVRSGRDNNDGLRTWKFLGYECV